MHDKARGAAVPCLGPAKLDPCTRPVPLAEMNQFSFQVLRPVMRTLSLLSALAFLMLAACGGQRMDITQMTAAQPVDLQVVHAVAATPTEYRIGVGDKLDIRVFQVEDLSFEELVVDTSGNINLPLIGAVRGAGRTAGEMSADIAQRLAARYLRDPQVTVTVKEAASQKITVDGAVTKPGVYEMRGSTSLLQAVAMAEGPTGVADLTQVAVFRTIDGQRSVAVFDLAAIRQGRASDPAVFGDDVIVVDTSRLNAGLRQLVGVIPALAIFRPY
jgi:polysaccharide export outer membrane protein